MRLLAARQRRRPRRLTEALVSAGFVVLTSMFWPQAVTAQDNKRELSFPHALAMRGCTQEDAPALEIYFTQAAFAGGGDPSPPFIRVEISSLPSETLAPLSLALIPLRRDPAKPGRIARAEFAESGHDRVWLSGTITLDEAAPGRNVTGHYDFTTPAGRRWEHSFSAQFFKRAAVCG